MLWVGTSPSARAAPASRQPPTSTRPARSSAGAHDAQSTYGSSGWGALALAVGRERARVACAPSPRAAARASSVAPFAQHVEQVAIGRLRPVPERAAEVVQQHDRAVLAERRGIAPEPHRMAEAGGGGGDRVQRLAGLVQREPRERHDDRVELARRAGSRGARRRAGAPRRARRPEGPARTATAVSSRPSCCSASVADLAGQRVDEASQRRVRDRRQRPRDEG